MRGAYPNTLHIECSAISRNSLVVCGLEEIVWAIFVNKVFAEPLDLRLEFIGRKNFVWECSKCQIKESDR
jgi:hypothetical protein